MVISTELASQVVFLHCIWMPGYRFCQICKEISQSACQYKSFLATLISCFSLMSNFSLKWIWIFASKLERPVPVPRQPDPVDQPDRDGEGERRGELDEGPQRHHGQRGNVPAMDAHQEVTFWTFILCWTRFCFISVFLKQITEWRGKT